MPADKDFLIPQILAASGYPALDGAQTGGYAGIHKVQLRGSNATVGGSFETVWAVATGTYAHITAAVAMEVLSNSANDAAAGTGARTVRVQYLDANHNIVNETVTMNGTTPVALASTALAVNNIQVLTAGSGLTNAGNIDVRTVSGSVQKMRISTVLNVSLGKSQDFIYTIPAGYVGVLGTVYFSATGATGDITVAIESHTSTGVRSSEGSGRASMSNTAFNPGQGEINFGAGGLFLPPKTTINAQALVSAGSVALNVNADLFLFKQGQVPNMGPLS